MRKALLLGIGGSFFFAFTFVLNRSMNLSGGYWIWSASLRFFFAFPMLALIVKKRHGFQNIHREIRQNPLPWLLWSTVGFGLFYAPLCYAGSHGESWLIAASWQVTIVMGVLMAPLFHQRIPLRNLAASGIILGGVFLLQLRQSANLSVHTLAVTLLPILLAAAAYPLGNRKMMALCGERLSTLERTYGMIVCSLPFWCILSLTGAIKAPLPSGTQALQAFCVALFSGVIATLLFFKATDSVRHSQKQLAVVEATQSGEVIFTLLGGILLLGDTPPDLPGYLGLLLIISGMVISAFLSSRQNDPARERCEL